MYKSILFLFLSIQFCFGQIDAYKQSYEQALKDSVISDEEQKMLDILQSSLKLSDADILNLTAMPINKSKLPINSQTGRTWIIVQNMSMGNGLYSWGIPYILNINDPGFLAGFQLLAFAGGYFISSSYTKNMHIPFGRAYFQNSGASLGLLSGLPLVMLIGTENWIDFDEDLKILTAWEMAAVPLGIWQADRLWRKWNLSDGQSSMVAKGVNLGLFNTWGLYTIITDIPENNTENWLRLGVPLSYAGGLAGGYLTHRYVSQKNYSRGDALFVTSGSAVGFFTFIELMILIDREDYRTNMSALLLTINGGALIADKLVSSINLTSGEAKIITLGAFASYLAWNGTALIINFDQSSDLARILDISAVLGGWYFTYAGFAKNKTGQTSLIKSHKSRLRLKPIVLTNYNKIIPGLQLTFSL